MVPGPAAGNSRPIPAQPVLLHDIAQIDPNGLTLVLLALKEGLIGLALGIAVAGIPPDPEGGELGAGGDAHGAGFSCFADGSWLHLRACAGRCRRELGPRRGVGSALRHTHPRRQEPLQRQLEPVNHHRPQPAYLATLDNFGT